MSISVDTLDPTSRALLPVMRNVLNAYLSPETLGWRHALAAAVGTWGEPRGLAIANHVQSFLGAVLSSRPVPLIFADPMDLEARKQLTHDESILLALLTAMGREETPRARDLIARLTGGRVEAAIVRSGLSLVARLDPMGTPKPIPRPKLQSVG